jgi:transcriptional regulator with XRE-family HTH domain
MPRSKVINRDAAIFGAIISRLRLERGWTFAVMSQQTGMNANYLSVMERGYNIPSLTGLFTLAAAFDMSPSDLLREFEQARNEERAARERLKAETKRLKAEG